MSEQPPGSQSLAASVPPLPPPPQWEGTSCLELVREFNERFLELLSRSAPGNGEHIPPDLVHAHRGAWLALDHTARERASRCPFLLADVQFRSPQWWQWASREDSRQPRAASPPSLFPLKLAVEVMYEVLVVTWYTARSGPQIAGILLGMSSAVCSIVAALKLKHLRHLATHHHRQLRPRWEQLPSFWPKLLVAACREDASRLHDVFRHGIQLLDQQSQPLPAASDSPNEHGG